MNIRALRDDDIEQVVALLSTALGSAPGGVDRRSLFEWKHFANPAGRSIGLVGEQDGAICGVRMFMRWEFRRPGDPNILRAVRAVDTATDPTLGRRGVFTSLTNAAVTEAERDGVAFVFNTPNEKSRPGYLKMGWSDVARWPVWIRVRRPHKLALAASRRRLAGGPAVEPPPGSGLLPAGDALSDPAAAELCEQDAATLSGIATNRSLRFLRWRYAEGPISYHVMKLEGPRRNGVAANITEVVGLVVVRLRLRGDLREVVICDVLARADGRGAIGAALRAVAAKADADHAVAHFGSAWPWSEVLSASGFRRLPRSGVRFTVRPLPASPSRALVLDAGSWALAPGDLELF